ncbi:MAG: 3-hydroxyacyl-CoA dehydrogenase family protein [Candidatus Adiutrix sp.]|jgi:3-hydroxybutyryl-CoA dehydrogenase|nr:3-hydroxyacyl-CoA dehydrogenase family protein [Candidatus Adiutrix sp.]
MRDTKNIAVLGAGTMGHGIAQCAATAGYAVILSDPDEKTLARGRAMIENSLKFMLSQGRLEPASAEAALSRITQEAEPRAAAARADFIFEAIFENLDLKQELFRSLGEWTGPEIILASNTSSFDIDRLAEAARHPERVIGAHWFHPAQITPALEVIPTARTSPETLAVVLDLAEKMGKYPTRCSNQPGFVANRIQFAMLAEVLAIIEEGAATPEEIDRIIKSSLGFRLGCFGPCEIADQAGLDVYKSIYESLYAATGRAVFQTPAAVTRLVQENRLGLKTGRGFYDYQAPGAGEAVLDRRDRRLMERLKLFERENLAN